jgi:hypothetical protein
MRRTWTLTVTITSPSKDRGKRIAEAIIQAVGRRESVEELNLRRRGKAINDHLYHAILEWDWSTSTSASGAVNRVAVLRSTRRWSRYVIIQTRNWWRDES